MLPLTLLVAVSILNAVIAVLVLSRSSRYRYTSLLFVLSAFMVVLWSIGDAVMLGAESKTIAYAGAVLFLVAPIWTMCFLFLFALRFPENESISSKILGVSFFVTATVSVLLVINLDAVIRVQATEVYLNRVYLSTLPYMLYALVFTVYFIAINWVFIRKVKAARRLRRTQIGYVFAGAFLSSIFAFFTNLALPLVDVSEYIWLGPIFTVIYIYSYTVAIAKYRLFDLRRAIVRAVAYVLTLASILGMYLLVGLIVRSSFSVGGIGVSIATDIFYIIMTAGAIIAFPFVKRAFDKITKNIFFRGDYDPQDVIDRFSTVLLHSLRRSDILDQSRAILQAELLSREVEFVFQHEPLEVHAKPAHERLLRLLADSGYDIVTRDELIEGSLYNIFDKEGIALAARLDTATLHLGWLMLGDKRNGEAYDTQDIKTLGIVVDEIAIVLENTLRYEEIQAFNETLRTKIELATAELRRTNKRLRLLDETKDDFISMASHQLRTPLTSIKGYLSMALDGDVGELKPEQRKILEEAFASSQRMVYLIGDFLNVSRLQTGKFELETASVHLTQLLADEISQLRATATSRNITFVYDPPSNFPLLQLDENKIRQVMMNFIDNAIYYAKPGGGTIRVELAHQADYVTFKVIDDGIGVPVSEQRHLFTKFYRATNARKARPDGTGIGLFMAKKVVVAHGGAILFESTEGKGSMFGFRLPVKAAEEATQRSAPAQQSAI